MRELVGGAEILYTTHNESMSGHMGIAKIMNRIKKRYYWTVLEKDVENFVKGCTDCQARKRQQHRKPVGLLQSIQLGMALEKIGMDLGPFRRSKEENTTIIVVTDYATRWAETGALPSRKTEHVAKFLIQSIFARHGSPRYILTDREAAFRSELVTQIVKMLGTANRSTTSYHSFCNGLTERFNKTLDVDVSQY